MKRFVITFCFLLFTTMQASAQTHSQWTDSLVVSETAADTTFTTERWETANIMFVGCDGYVQLSLSPLDTTGWAGTTSGKNWLYLPEESILVIEKDRDLGIPGLYRLGYKAASGTGALFITGTKKTYE